MSRMSGQIETVVLTAATLVEEFHVNGGDYSGSHEYVLSPVYNEDGQMERVPSTVRDVTVRTMAEEVL